MSELATTNPVTLNEIANIINSKKYGYKYVCEINEDLTKQSEKIFKEKSIFLFESINQSKTTELDNIFNEYLSKISLRHFNVRKIDDEIKILQQSYSIDKYYFKPDSFIDRNEEQRKKNSSKSGMKSRGFEYSPLPTIFARSPISIRDTFKYALEYDYANRVDNSRLDGLSLFFLTKKIDFLNKEKILLSIFGQTPSAIGKYEIVGSFVFSEDIFGDMITQPMRLFLKILDYYGEDIIINETTKRFWDHEYLPKKSTLFNRDLIEIKNIERNRYKSEIFMSVYSDSTPFSDAVYFAFAINFGKYFHDLKEEVI